MYTKDNYYSSISEAYSNRVNEESEKAALKIKAAIDNVIVSKKDNLLRASEKIDERYPGFLPGLLNDKEIRRAAKEWQESPTIDSLKNLTKMIEREIKRHVGLDKLSSDEYRTQTESMLYENKITDFFKSLINRFSIDKELIELTLIIGAALAVSFYVSPVLLFIVVLVLASAYIFIEVKTNKLKKRIVNYKI